MGSGRRMNATSTIPIVMTGTGGDPVEEGLVRSLARPGGNVTGLTNLTRELGGKRLELLKETIPKLAQCRGSLQSGSSWQCTRGERGSSRRGACVGVVTLRPWEIRPPEDFERVFAALSKQRPYGLYVTTGPQMGANRKRFADFAWKSRLPSTGPNKEFVDAGGLMYYGAGPLANSYRRVAVYIDKILKGAEAVRSAGRTTDEV